MRPAVYGQFRRALDRGNELQARAAGAELGEIPLSDALELLLLIARKEPICMGGRHCAGMAATPGRCVT